MLAMGEAGRHVEVAIVVITVAQVVTKSGVSEKNTAYNLGHGARQRRPIQYSMKIECTE